MVFITEDMIRRRAEHNNMEITTLEEISLHQQDIEKIEYIDKWCRNLTILYLQSNLISKIENVSRLKKLKYLNLALNNVEKIENLEGCESLEKLDLTVNFVGELTSIDCLKPLYNFKELYLTGNPCTQYEYYREYVVASLPQLQRLDGKDIERSEKIVAMQEYDKIKQKIIEQQENHARERAAEKLQEKKKQERKPGFDGRWYTDTDAHIPKNYHNENEHEHTANDVDTAIGNDDTSKGSVWQEKVSFTPESRVEAHKQLEEQRKQRDNTNDSDKMNPPKRQVRLMTDDGRILNVNEAKIDFQLIDDEDNNTIVLDVGIYRYMDTSLIDVDIQPNYVRVTIKSKILQLALSEEVSPDNAVAKRSQTTGHLVITMPKVKQVIKPLKKPTPKPTPKLSPQSQFASKTSASDAKSSRIRFEKLEIGDTTKNKVDIHNIVQDPHENKQSNQLPRPTQQKEATANDDSNFYDDPDVPPLE